MGSKDSVTKVYIGQADRFADLFNGYCFQGKKKVLPENLRDMDTASIVLPYGADGAELPEQKARDVLKMLLKTDGKAAYCILGVENQSEIHTAMPVRNMLYDAMTLTEQVALTARSHKAAGDSGTDKAEFLSGFHRHDRLLPVITIVVHWGAETWDAPLSLREMYPDCMDEDLLKYAADYHVNLVSPALMMDNELDVFESDLKAVLKFLKHSNNKEELSKLVTDNAEFENIERLTAQTISICSNVDFNIPGGEERINLCKAIEDMKEDARKEGRNEERKKALTETEERAKDMIRDHMDLSLVEKYTRLSLPRIKELAQGLEML